LQVCVCRGYECSISSSAESRGLVGNGKLELQ
jgi:hypothetical protein